MGAPPVRGHEAFVGAFYYAPQLVPPGTAEARISYGISVCLSVRPSVCPSRPGTDSMPDEIETPGLHHMVAWSI